MRVSEIFEERSAFSFEVFPPKTDVGMHRVRECHPLLPSWDTIPLLQKTFKPFPILKEEHRYPPELDASHSHAPG